MFLSVLPAKERVKPFLPLEIAMAPWATDFPKLFVKGELTTHAVPPIFWLIWISVLERTATALFLSFKDLLLITWDGFCKVLVHVINFLMSGYNFYSMMFKKGTIIWHSWIFCTAVIIESLQLSRLPLHTTWSGSLTLIPKLLLTKLSSSRRRSTSLRSCISVRLF